jgi:hypothetical protein
MPNKLANLALGYWNDNVEYLFCGLVIPADSKILLDPNTWIVNAAASVHITVHKDELQGEHKTAQTEIITMGNGSTEATVEI